jgi:hypothetical protein
MERKQREVYLYIGTFDARATDTQLWNVGPQIGFCDLGFDTIFFHCPGPDQRAFLTAYARDALPRLRSR